MSVVEDFAGSTIAWLSQNVNNIIYSAVAAIVLFVFYRFSVRQIDRLEKQRVQYSLWWPLSSPSSA